MGSTNLKEVSVRLGDRSYDIRIGVGNLDQLGELVAASGTKGSIGIVTDSNVGPRYAEVVVHAVSAAGRACVVHTLPAGEEHKRLDQIEAICGTFLAGGLDRSSLIIALGGGVVGDIAGFAAAVFMRGIPFVQVPTTIVAQVDSSVGGKTAVNHALSKNSIGSFHQPIGVLIDMALLQSLPERELRAGLAEAIKHGIIADAELFGFMEANAALILAKDPAALAVPVVRSCEIKAVIVSEDETEQGVRANLNYGHTFGHAIESVSHYKTFLHGEAIAIGMCAAAAMARALGMVDDDFVARQRACFAAYGLPTTWPTLPVDEALDAMKRDKKVRAGLMKFILPTRMGEVVQRTDISEAQARAALEAVRV